MIPFGPFDLETSIGSGGMGEVWRGVHRRQRVPVAVKFLSGERSHDERFLSAFRQEVRAVAGLDHPSIVLVLDYGIVSPTASEASEGALSAGNPYLAMELVDGGSLADLCGRVPWAETKSILARMLDALCHAHARGTIHRDIKPANVLRIASTGAIKVTDFGLSHVFDRFGSEKHALEDGVYSLIFKERNAEFKALNECFSLVGTRLTTSMVEQVFVQFAAAASRGNLPLKFFPTLPHISNYDYPPQGR